MEKHSFRKYFWAVYVIFFFILLLFIYFILFIYFFFLGGGGGGWTNYRVFHLWCITTPSNSLINDYMYRNVLFPLCHLLITLANGLDQDKDRRSCKKNWTKIRTDRPFVTLILFLKRLIFETVRGRQQKHAKLPSMQIVNSTESTTVSSFIQVQIKN